MSKVQVIKKGTKAFRDLFFKNRQKAKKEGRKTFSVGSFKNIPVTRSKARKKDLTGLTEAQKKERASVIEKSRKVMKKYKRGSAEEAVSGMGERGSVALADRVQSLNPKAKGKSIKEILKAGRVTGRTYQNKYFIERANAPTPPKLSNEQKSLRKQLQLGKRPKELMKEEGVRTNKDILDYIRGDIKPKFETSQASVKLRGKVRPTVRQKITDRTNKVIGEEEVLRQEAKELKKFPKRKTINKALGRKQTSSSLKKAITKVRANDFGGEKKSFADSLLGRQSKPKITTKTMKSKKELDAMSPAQRKKFNVKGQIKFSETVEKADVKRIKTTLEKVEDRLMSNPAVATLKDLKSRPLIKNAKPTRVGRKFLGPLRNEKNPYYSLKQRIEKLQQKQKETKPKLVGRLQEKLKAVAGFKDIPKSATMKGTSKKEVIKRKSGGMVKYKSGTKSKTVGKKKKGIGKYIMGVLGPSTVYDVMELGDALGTGLKATLGMKSGTKSKTIRGVGKAMRGYGKAITGRKK